ncbi:MAG: YvcK family protein [Chloroflexales bacterium]|nr:YvcK family protein [Chloroflexales bacterium]
MRQQQAIVLGGGGGVSVTLQAIPDTFHKTAIIAVTDTGRSTGLARTIGGDMPAPGDIRATIAATAQNRQFAQLLQHRFDGAGMADLAGMNLGNLILAGLYRELGNFEAAVAALASLAQSMVTVLPVSAVSTQLCAHLIDGSDYFGEFAVRAPHKAPIATCWLTPQAPALPAACQAIRDADIVFIGPGSFYTTLHAVLLPDGIRDALADCRAKVVFIANTTTQTGQTEHLDIVGHVAVMAALLGAGVLDIVILNSRPATANQIAFLDREGLRPLNIAPEDIDLITAMGVQVLAIPLSESDDSQRTLWNKQDTVRHDISALRSAILTVLS